MEIIKNFEELKIFEIEEIETLKTQIMKKENIEIATNFLSYFKIYLSGKYLLIIAYIYKLKDDFFNINSISDNKILNNIKLFIDIIKNKNYELLKDNNIIKILYDVKSFIDKSKIENLKLLIDKYVEIKSNMNYIYENYSDKCYELIDNLNKQKENIINLGKKYYQDINQDFYDKIYDITSEIKNKVDENYWKIIVQNMNNNDFTLFNKNIQDIKNKIIIINKNINLDYINIDVPNKTSCIQNILYLINEISKLSSPIRDIEYKIFYDIINDINNINYHEKLCMIIKNIYKFIDNIYADLFIINL